VDAEIAEETERLVQRDAKDATQTVQAKDAVLIDTTYLTQAEQVERIVSLARVFLEGGPGQASGGPG
jgi:cytidylate kinase